MWIIKSCVTPIDYLFILCLFWILPCPCARCKGWTEQWWFPAGYIVRTRQGGLPVQFILVFNVSPCSLFNINRLWLPHEVGRDFAHFDLQTSRWIFEEILNGPIVTYRVLGEEDSWKNLKQKISCHCPFKIQHNMLKLRLFITTLTLKSASSVCKPGRSNN